MADIVYCKSGTIQIISSATQIQFKSCYQTFHFFYLALKYL